MKKRMSIVLLLALLLQTVAPSAAAASDKVTAEKTASSAVAEAAPDEAGIRPMSLFDEFTVDGVSYREITDQASANEVMVSRAADGATAVTVPDEVTNPITNETFRVSALRASAFSGHKTLTSVTLPDSITEISEGAFEKAAALESVSVSDKVTRFANSAFRHCTALTTVNFPSALQSIGYAAFSNTALGGDIDLTHCIQLTTIGQSAFGYSEVGIDGYPAPPITAFIMPNSVTEIGPRCFSDAVDKRNTLKKVVFSENITVLPEGVLRDCSQLTDLTLPPNLTSVGDSAFLNCSSLAALPLPNSVAAIGVGAFKGCASLTSFTLPSSVTVVPPNAFMYCAKLASITLPEGVTEIGASAFEGCSSLTEIVLPSTLTSVGKSSFYYCRALVNINLQATKITKLPEDVFRDCKKLTSVNRLELPSTLTTLESGAFSNISTSLAINTTVEDVAKKINRDKNRLAPNMSESSFTVYLSGTPYTIKADPEPARPHQPFYTTKPTGSGTNPQENYYYTPLTANTAMAQYSNGGYKDDRAHTVTIPETVTNPVTNESYRVVKLGKMDTFSENIAPLPASITEYDVSAFSGCTKLKEFVMNDSVTKIGRAAFQWLPNLEKITLSANLVEIPQRAFEGCSKLKEVVIPASVQHIGEGAFFTSGITTLTIPDTVKTLDGGIAKSCKQLETVSIGSGVTVIPAQAFYNTPKLTSLTLPKNLEVIVDQAFAFTSKLTHVSLPETVTQISSYAFYKSGLTRTKLPGNAKIDTWAFETGELFVESETQLQAIATVGATKNETYHTIVDKISINNAPPITNTGKLTATVTGTYSQDVASVDWTSSAPTIATIGKKTGEVTVLKDGDVTFTATSRYGKTLTTDASGAITAVVPAADSVKVAVAIQAPGGGGGDDDTYYTVTFRAGENGTLSGTQSYQVREGGRLTAVPNATPNKGFEFLGWSTDGKTTVDPRAASVTKNTTYTALYRAQNPGDLLNREDHTVPFIQGDNREMFRPEADITRAEVAAIFSRIMPQGTPAPAAAYRDVARDAWYASAVDRLTALGIFSGYPDGTFHPEQPISRSELTAVIARFSAPETAGNSTFTDVDSTFWAAQYIQTAAAYGWVQGYPDGTFRPEQPILRTETVVMVNRLLGRRADTAYIDANVQKLTTFSDMPVTHWAYYDVMEAANGHKYTREGDAEHWSM